MDEGQEKMMKSNSPKRRIHEQDYAVKVVSQKKIDKQTIQLNESLFNAKITASQSSNLIKEIFRSVQQKIRKFDDYLKNNESFRKQQNEKSILAQEEIKIKQEAAQLEKLSKKQSEEQNTMTQTNTMNQFEQELLQTPKNDKKEKAKFDLPINGSKSNQRKQAQSVNTKRELLSNTPQQSQRKNSPQKRATTQHKSFFALNQIKNENEMRLTGRAQTARTLGIAERNTEWKQKLEQRIKKEQQKQQLEELQKCTFKPNIVQQRQIKSFQKSVSKEFQNELKELVHLIDSSSKKKKQQSSPKKKMV